MTHDCCLATQDTILFISPTWVQINNRLIRIFGEFAASFVTILKQFSHSKFTNKVIREVAGTNVFADHC